MAEWLRPGLWEVLTIKLRGIEPDQILAHKRSIGWADGDENTSRRYYGWRKPNFGGQYGRVVKAGALGGTHVYVAWDRTWSNSDSQKVHRLGGW